MADLTITAASVVSGAGARKSTGVAGETITAGQVVYKSPTTGLYMKADADSATAAARAPDGVALNGAAVNQPLFVHEGGLINLGATLTPGLAYYLSGTAGGICPIADVGTGEYVVLLGLAVSAAQLDLDIQAAGVAN